MKRMAFVALAVVSLMGCDLHEMRRGEDKTIGGFPLAYITVVDPDTGCQYLGYLSHGLTPRLDRNGKPICGIPAQP